jgi:hypothetical protein
MRRPLGTSVSESDTGTSHSRSRRVLMRLTIARPGSGGSRVGLSCDGGDVSVVEVDRLVESAAEGDGKSGEDVLSGDFAAFDL